MISRLIISYSYKPNTAATNRVLALAKEFARHNVDVILILGLSKELELPNLENVQIVPCIASHHLLIYKMCKLAKDFYIEGKSIIYSYGTSLHRLFLPKDIKLICEFTEIPFYGRRKNIVNSIKEYVKLKLALKSTGIFVITQSLYDYYSNAGVKNIEIINMFVDTSRFNSQNIASNSDKYIAYCGTISEFKDGVDCLIRAFSVFQKEYSDYKLKIIGKFESQTSERNLRSLVSQLELNSNVEFTGMVSSQLMPTILSSAKILALARPDNEQSKYGFPTKLGEYLATGVPVVVTNVGELNYFLKDKVNCIFSKPDNYLDFASKLMWVADNYSESCIIAQEGKRLTQNEFSVETQVNKALCFINKHV